MRANRAAILLTLCSAGCTESGGRGVDATLTPALVVDPAQFLGDVLCVSAPGGLRRYVATLADVTPPPADSPPIDVFVLPSSTPTSCFQPVYFSRVSVGGAYVADIDGYDRDDLTPHIPGSRILVDASGTVVPPRWRTTCGRGEPSGSGGPVDGGTETDSSGIDAALDAGSDTGTGFETGAPDTPPSVTEGGTDADADADPEVSLGLNGPTVAAFTSNLRRILVRGCQPLAEVGMVGLPTSIVIDLGAARAAVECGGEVGQIARFDATLRGETRSAACGQTVAFEGLNPGEGYTVTIAAYEAGSGSPRWQTRCFQVAERGISLKAVCDPLRQVTAGPAEAE